MSDENRQRLSELAAELKVSTRRVQELAELGGIADMPTSHFSYLTDEQVTKIRIQHAKALTEEAPTPAPVVPAKPKYRYFASLASELRLDNYIPEVKGRDNGVLISPARSLDFNEGIKVTLDQHEIDFIRNTVDPEEIATGIFRSGTVREFDTMEGAIRFRREVAASKMVRHVTSEDSSEATYDRVTGGLQDAAIAQAKVG